MLQSVKVQVQDVTGIDTGQVLLSVTRKYKVRVPEAVVRKKNTEKALNSTRKSRSGGVTGIDTGDLLLSKTRRYKLLVPETLVGEHTDTVPNHV